MTTILIGFYTGEILSLTMSPLQSEKPIDLAEDLVRSGKLWITKKGTITSRGLELYPELQKTKVYGTSKASLEDDLSKILEKPDTYIKAKNIRRSMLQAIRHMLEPERGKPILFW